MDFLLGLLWVFHGFRIRVSVKGYVFYVMLLPMDTNRCNVLDVFYLKVHLWKHGLQVQGIKPRFQYHRENAGALGMGAP